MTASLIGIACVLALSLLRVPIAFAMGLVGFVGFGLIVNWEAALAQISTITSDTVIDYGLSVVPLFVLMGSFVTRARLSDDLYNASHAFLGHRRGGLAMATVVACGGFGAICGSSVATAATMAKVAMPSMRRFGYKDYLAAGSVAGGGTLGILIPPSIVLIIYGILTQESIGKLFAAGIVPGLVAIVCYTAAVRLVITLDPAAGPKGEKTAWRARMRAMNRVWGVLALFTLVIGGIYGGVFTPTEAAGIGAAGAMFFALGRGIFTPAAPRGLAPLGRIVARAVSGRGRRPAASVSAAATPTAPGAPDQDWRDLRTFGGSIGRGRLDWRGLFDVLSDSAYTTAMLFVVLIGALLFANFVNDAGLPAALTKFVGGLEVSPYLVIWVILLIYIALGCVFESISMVLLTVPVFFPLVGALGFDLVWFGIVVVCVTELSLITPPVGINIFVLRAVLPDVTTGTLIKGVLPFCAADIVRLAILVHIPWLSLVVPNLLFK